jgi:hypothetical protein
LNESHVHFDLDTKDTLTKENMTHGVVDVVTSRLTRMNHEPVGKLHRLCTSSAELSGYDNLTALCTGLHDKPKYTIARPAANSVSCGTPAEVSVSPTNGETAEKLVSQALTLCNSRKTPGLHLLGIEFKGVLREFESFLDEGGKLANSPTFLAKNFLGMCGTNDDLRVHVQAAIY